MIDADVFLSIIEAITDGKLSPVIDTSIIATAIEKYNNAYIDGSRWNFAVNHQDWRQVNNKSDES